MVDLVFRPARPDDIATIAAINTAGQPGVSPLTAEAVAYVLADAPYVTVAVLDGEVAGYMIGYMASDAYDGEEFAWFRARLPRFLYIDQIAVAPAARRAGVGAHLYAHAVSFAGAHMAASLVCEVNLEPPNPASLRFHARLGFREVGVLTVSDGRTVSLRQRGPGPDAAAALAY